MWLAMSVTNISCQKSQVNSGANILHNNNQQKCDCPDRRLESDNAAIPPSQRKEDCSDLCITAMSSGGNLPKNLEDKVDALCRHKILHALQTECPTTIHCSKQSDSYAGAKGS